MTEKWTKKEVLEYAKELRSPFEDGQKPKLLQLGDKVRQALLKTRMV